MDQVKRRKPEDERRKEFKVRLPKWLCDETRKKIAASGMKQAHYVEHVLINAAHPDPSRMLAIDALKKINHDQARLGNLLNAVLTDPDLKSKFADIDELFGEIRNTQQTIKAKVLAL
ncbi:hypothetical protein QT397_02205 (plasmid) [Microbulbifer sp. MKSA007]|uniref:Plasmid mobilization relaxosome protein MobC n=1 Tax=Pseudovibrio brasiliensis TaxID=1898042 RepID=A0ABX8AVP3_9HYPH|nr:hypothetical protein [Pseudovibrio brasiliensis]QUS59123.1 hypothetical protein KGB56_26755 [Pseudovibrio brasiliensis]WNZ54079.1 hypothetical protein QT397_02205 [Microbulbifer sp. MKSA007]